MWCRSNIDIFGGLGPTDDPTHDIIDAEDKMIGNIGHFLKIEESAMCKICSTKFREHRKVKINLT